MRNTISAIVVLLLAVAASLLLSSALIALVGRNPLEVFQQMWDGAFGNISRIGGVFNFWIPLTLASLGLVVTFRAGLWNIGVEGQMMLGAIFASGVAIFWNVPAFMRVPGAIIAAAIGGMLWAMTAGVLKTRLGVHEIFGGVAFNAIANVVANYLITNLWSPPGGNARDTGAFDQAGRLQAFSQAFPTSIPMIIITLALAVVTIIALAETRWGLELKAAGRNSHSALLLGVPVEQTSLSAFAFCGALAGLGGAYRVLFVYGTLPSLASGGIGFLGILVVLLASSHALWVPVTTFAFAALLVGSTSLRVSMGLDASMTKSFQGTLVLIIILSNGLRTRVFPSRPNRHVAQKRDSDTLYA